MPDDLRCQVNKMYLDWIANFRFSSPRKKKSVKKHFNFSLNQCRLRSSVWIILNFVYQIFISVIVDITPIITVTAVHLFCLSSSVLNCNRSHSRWTLLHAFDNINTHDNIVRSMRRNRELPTT